MINYEKSIFGYFMSIPPVYRNLRSLEIRKDNSSTLIKDSSFTVAERIEKAKVKRVKRRQKRLALLGR